jgi:hypothetical protein
MRAPVLVERHAALICQGIDCLMLAQRLSHLSWYRRQFLTDAFQ